MKKVKVLLVHVVTFVLLGVFIAEHLSPEARPTLGEFIANVLDKLGIRNPERYG